MSIITISRGSYSRGKEVAEKVAERLGYKCFSRDGILNETSEEFNIPEVKLERAIHDAPSILDRFTHGRERFVAFFQAALLEEAQRGNMVYHGLAGHFFLHGVSHVLKVRIIADMDDRVRLEMEREGCSANQALHLLKRDDEERRKWSRHLYGIDTADSSLYDLVIHIQTITVDEAVELIAHTVGLAHFKPTPESKAALNDLRLAAHIKAALITEWPDIHVTATDGRVQVKTQALASEQEAVFQRIRTIALEAGAADDVQIDVKADVS